MDRDQNPYLGSDAGARSATLGLGLPCGCPALKKEYLGPCFAELEHSDGRRWRSRIEPSCPGACVVLRDIFELCDSSAKSLRKC